MKKITILILSAAMILVAVMGFVACGEKEDKPEKYDVAIRVGCTDGNIYEFSLGTDEMHIEIPYDGIEREYGVHSYNMPDHPQWGDEWFRPKGEGAQVFGSRLVYTNQSGVNETVLSAILPGEYCLNITAPAVGDWNYRHIWLFITIE